MGEGGVCTSPPFFFTFGEHVQFKVALSHIPVGGTAAEGKLLHTDRIYTCDSCRTHKTGWRHLLATEIPGVPCCSDECFDQQVEALKEEETRTAPVLPRSSVDGESACRDNEREQGKKGSDHR